MSFTLMCVASQMLNLKKKLALETLEFVVCIFYIILYSAIWYACTCSFNGLSYKHRFKIILRTPFGLRTTSFSFDGYAKFQSI